jgi:Ca-activated chloride channel family protein
MPDVIALNGLFNKNQVPYLNQHQLLYALLEIRPQGTAARQGGAPARLPLNFSLILDKSGSMSGVKIEHLRHAVAWMLNQLRAEDFVSIVAFNSETELLVPTTRATEVSALLSAVERLKAGGGTRMGKALRTGLEQVEPQIRRDRISRLILLTDGQTYNDEDECREIASAAGHRDVPLVALGLGTDWNEELLEALAQRSGEMGYADLIRRPDEVATIFQEVYGRMQVVAQDLLLRLLMVQGMEARRVWQVTPLIRDISLRSIQGSTVAIRLPDVEEGGAAFLVEILLPPRPVGRYRLAQAEVSYTVPAAVEEEQKARVDMIATVTADAAAAREVNGHVMNIVERVTAHRLQTQALDEAAMGNIASATRKLRAAHTRLLDQGETELAQTALEEAERLERGEGLSNEGRKTIKLQSRKTGRLSDLDLDLP